MYGCHASIGTLACFYAAISALPGGITVTFSTHASGRISPFLKSRFRSLQVEKSTTLLSLMTPHAMLAHLVTFMATTVLSVHCTPAAIV
jgi:hypothetical protein